MVNSHYYANCLGGPQVIRSVLPNRGIVYTGSYKQFDYWERGDADADVMKYTSLIPLILDCKMQNESGQYNNDRS